MTHVLEHRGPDDFGFAFVSAERQLRWRDEPPLAALGEGVALGHRRLSILDLSEAGRQPFWSEDGRYWLVYNGELYNYIELRDELEHAGWRFRTGTDTEVVLKAYQHWGDGCFARFNGMWGLVIWDNERQQLVASRDRFGIKPLYYQRIGGDWVFASEVKAILEHPSARRAPDDEVVFGYLSGLGGLPADRTFFADVHAVEPATILKVCADRVEARRYWTAPSGPTTEFGDVTEAATRLRQLLEDSVRLRMRSDVRLGTMLSGGLDSTSVIRSVRTLMAASGGTHTAAGDVLQAFTAMYPGTRSDEEAEVDELCAMLELKANKVFPAEEDGLAELLGQSVWHMERPYFNSVPMVHTLLMRKARAVGVKVVLNGHGPDEMLAGYPGKYGPILVGELLASGRLRSAWWEINALRERFGLGRRTALKRSLATRIPGIVEFHRRRRKVANDAMLGGENGERVVRRPPLRQWWCKGLEDTLRHDFATAVLPQWLHLEDRISMACSIEARLPFLDYRIVEFAFRLPKHMKMHNGMTKRVLRAAMQGALPESIRARSRKVPFSGPDERWLKGGLHPTLAGCLLDGTPMIASYVRPHAVRDAVRSFMQGEGGRPAPEIWKLLNVEAWMRAYFA